MSEERTQTKKETWIIMTCIIGWTYHFLTSLKKGLIPLNLFMNLSDHRPWCTQPQQILGKLGLFSVR